MLLNRVNRSNPDRIFVSVYNVEGATITTGYPVAFANVTSIDGVSVVNANASGDYPGFLGVARSDIANNDYGLVQIWGYCASVLLSNVGTSITINAGDPLVPGPKGFFSAAPAYANSGFKFIIASNVPAAVSAAAYASGVIRGL